MAHALLISECGYRVVRRVFPLPKERVEICREQARRTERLGPQQLQIARQSAHAAQVRESVTGRATTRRRACWSQVRAAHQ